MSARFGECVSVYFGGPNLGKLVAPRTAPRPTPSTQDFILRRRTAAESMLARPGAAQKGRGVRRTKSLPPDAGREEDANAVASPIGPEEMKTAIFKTSPEQGWKLPQFESRWQAGSQRAFGTAGMAREAPGQGRGQNNQRSKSALWPGTRPRMCPAGLVR